MFISFRLNVTLSFNNCRATSSPAINWASLLFEHPPEWKKSSELLQCLSRSDYLEF